MDFNFGIITNCTARKRAGGQVLHLTQAELNNDPTKIVELWLDRASRSSPVLTVGELYGGRSMTESKAVASHLSATFHVISAGLGLAARDELAPNYDLTIAKGLGSLMPALARAGMSPDDWWQLLNLHKSTPLPLSNLINGLTDTRFLLALPSTYLAMIESDLAHINEAALTRLSIFTSTSGASNLSSRLQQRVIYYDERLEGEKNYAGTRADFPQRAMRHFVHAINGHKLDVKQANEAVSEALSKLKKPVLPKRIRKSDSEITELIRTEWNRYSGNSGQLLRFLRDEALVSCEQSRFSHLRREIQAQMS